MFTSVFSIKDDIIIHILPSKYNTVYIELAVNYLKLNRKSTKFQLYKSKLQLDK